MAYHTHDAKPGYYFYDYKTRERIDFGGLNGEWAYKLITISCREDESEEHTVTFNYSTIKSSIEQEVNSKSGGNYILVDFSPTSFSITADAFGENHTYVPGMGYVDGYAYIARRVYITRKIYKDGVYYSDSSVVAGEGTTFTPSSNKPSTPTGYTYSYCSPSSSFEVELGGHTVSYYYVRKSYTITKNIYLDGVFSSSETTTAKYGNTITPSNIVPDTPKGYKYSHCDPADAFTVSSATSINYYFVKKIGFKHIRPDGTTKTGKNVKFRDKNGNEYVILDLKKGG